MKNLEKQYRKTVQKNLEKLESIIRKEIKTENYLINRSLKLSLENAYDNIAKKWLSGKKHLRTYFVRMAIKPYPKNMINLSISLDATINILDDLLDENLESEVKALYVLELIRSLAVTHNQDYNKKISKKIEHYFNKIISIAILENVYRQKLEKEEEFKKIVESSTQIYSCRSLDMDIYVELALTGKKKLKHKDIIKISRVFRAITLIKKDLEDLEHDKEQGIETVVSIAHRKGILTKLVLELVRTYRREATGIVAKNKNPIIKNFMQMIKKETINIKRIIEQSNFI
jgi:hypothetical protein